MPHDKNGVALSVGDKVTVECTITNIGQTDDYCNVTLKTVEKMYPSNEQLSFISLNGKQVVKVGLILLVLLLLPLQSLAQISEVSDKGISRVRSIPGIDQRHSLLPPIQTLNNSLVSPIPLSSKRTYMDAAREAISKQVPFVVFVDCERFTLSGEGASNAVVYECKAGEWYDMTKTVWSGYFVAIPDKVEVLGVIEKKSVPSPLGKEVGSRPSPFVPLVVVNRGGEVTNHSKDSQSSLGDYLLDRLATADDNDLLEVSSNKPANWPSSVPFPKGLATYTRAKYTQSIFKLDNTPTIRSVHRKNLLVKWQMSGGMEGLRGWKSEVFKLVPGTNERAYRTLLPVANGFGSTQQEYGYTRSYPNGTLFVDMLTNAETGKVFEHRIAEKENGKWRRYVAFRDEKERPLGYTGLKGITCTTCHNTTDGPGTGGYGVGLVPGGDTIVSDPLIGLER